MQRSAALAIALTLVATPGLAGDGALEINETCAVLTGCFPGDAPLLPVTISANEGRYRLTSNLHVNGAGVSGIEIVPGVAADIDLNGFVIQGIASCLGIPATNCSPAGSGVGISGGNDVTVHDGIIRGMGNDGIRLSWSARVENVNVVHNVGTGIRVGQGSLVRGSISASNGGRGISADLEARIVDNLVSGNGLAGIFAQSGVVTGNSSARNGGAGGTLGAAVAFEGNSFTANLGGSRVGGAPTGGNVCDDGGCTRDNARRYYQTATTHTGSQALTACAAGFHMASFAELMQSSPMRYVASTSGPGDQGYGPPSSEQGWVRTGGFSGQTLAFVGRANCALWTSDSQNPLHYGTTAKWGASADWFLAPSHPPSPWEANYMECFIPQRVWCIED